KEVSTTRDVRRLGSCDSLPPRRTWVSSTGWIGNGHVPHAPCNKSRPRRRMRGPYDVVALIWTVSITLRDRGRDLNRVPLEHVDHPFPRRSAVHRVWDPKRSAPSG